MLGQDMSPHTEFIKVSFITESAAPHVFSLGIFFLYFLTSQVVRDDVVSQYIVKVFIDAFSYLTFKVKSTSGMVSCDSHVFTGSSVLATAEMACSSKCFDKFFLNCTEHFTALDHGKFST